MKTLLIDTPYPVPEIPQMPMGLAYVAALLERQGVEVQVQDFLVEKYCREKLAHKIADFSPRIAGATSVTMNYPIASQILRDCKDIDPDIITVIGGPHVSFTAEETLRESPWIDVVVRGEGEYTMLDLANGKKFREIEGIAFRENDSIVLTPPRPWIENLDELPFPARHLFPLPRYLALGNECGLISSRGCPFNCIFCVGHKMVGRRGRFRNPKLVVDEIEDILSKGFQVINIVDDLFTLNRRHVYAFCDEVEARNLKFGWTAFSRVDTVNREVLGRMKEAGCFFLCYGVESGNQQILDTAKKKITLEKTREAVKLAKEVGIKVLASFIIGLPGETAETLKQTVDFAKELETSYGFHILAPFPGTELRERAEELGIRILTDDWLKYNADEAITETQGATAEMLNEVDRQYQEGISCYTRYLDNLDEQGQSNAELTDLMKGRRREIVSLLLQNDVIENLGSLRIEGDIVENLAAEIGNRIPYPLPVIRKMVPHLVNEGILKYERLGEDVVWRWGWL